MEERIQMGSLVKKVDNGYIIWDRDNKKFRLCEGFSVEKDNGSFLDDLADSFNITRGYGIETGLKYVCSLLRFCIGRLLGYSSREEGNPWRSYPWF